MGPASVTTLVSPVAGSQVLRVGVTEDGAATAVRRARLDAAGAVRVVVVSPRPSTALDQAEDAAVLGSADLDWLRSPSLVSVAALGRPGSGRPVQGEMLEVALACRMRVLAQDTTLRADWAARGTVPAAWGLARLASLVGDDRAAELALTGRVLSAAEAARYGLATLVVPPGDLPSAVDDLVAALLATPREVTAEVLAQLDHPEHDPREAQARLDHGPG